MASRTSRPQGGDVSGTEETNIGKGTKLKPLAVAKASYHAGYSDDTDDTYGMTPIEIKTGYSSYGRDKVGAS